MHRDLRHELAPRQFQHREQVVLVAVHAAGREQAEQVQRCARARAPRRSRAQFVIGEEAAVLDGRVDAGEVLVDDAPGAEVHVPDFGIAHLPVRQADVAAFGVHQRVRAFGPELAPMRQFGLASALSAGSSRWPQPSRISNTTGLGRAATTTEVQVTDDG